jgi:hypothetical protein
MDEIRRLRFFIPVAVYVLFLYAFDPAFFIETIKGSLKSIACWSEPDKLVPTAAVLAIGSAFALAVGFLISTFTQIVIQILIRFGCRKLRVQLGMDSSERLARVLQTPDIDDAGLQFAASAFHHSLPIELAKFIFRRWEMVNVSANSIVAIILAFVSVAFHGLDHPNCWLAFALATIVALYLCICRSLSEMKHMTELLLSCRGLKLSIRDR